MRLPGRMSAVPAVMDVTTLSAAVSTRRLLVVEDDDSIRETVGEALRAEGFEVHTCADGASALNLITAETFRSGGSDRARSDAPRFGGA